MANFKLYFPELLKHEGGYTNDPTDHGGATNLGVTLQTWKDNGWDKNEDGDIDIQDIKLLTPADAEVIAKKLYWDRVKGDQIKSQSLAELLFDWAYMSGPSKAIKKLQEVLGTTMDGVIGNKTLFLVNAGNAKLIFDLLKQSREKFFYSIVENNPSQKRWIKGWINRNNKFTFHD